MRNALTVLLVVFVLALEVGCGGVAKVVQTNTWTNTGGSVGQGKNNGINSLAYDSTHNLLYAGTKTNGVWKYDGTNWTNTGGAVSSYGIDSLAYDSGHNVLYAGVYDPSTSKNIKKGVWKYDGNTWTDTTSVGVSGTIGRSLACDSGHSVLYSGTDGEGVWKYNGTNWTNTGGGVSTLDIPALD